MPAAYRTRPLCRRLGGCLRALRAETEAAAVSRLREHPQLLDPSLETLLIGVTSFYRDPAVFDLLRAQVMPALAARGTIRVWSAGASDGAELYSVGMMLGEAGLLGRAELLGTDCRPQAIARARAGTFSDVLVSGVAPALRDRYFVRTSKGWQVVADLRARASWQRRDATRYVPPGAWDLVLCRNLAIYLKPPSADAMFRAMARSLAPGGVLVVGKAERPPSGLDLTALGRCVYRKVADAE